MQVPMHVKSPSLAIYLAKGSTTRDKNKRVQHFWFGKMWDHAIHEKENSLRMQAPLAGDKVCTKIPVVVLALCLPS